jgi:fibronectin type 3 domain-containing protein
VRAKVSKNYSAYSANVPARWLATPAAPTLTNYTSGIKAVWSEVKGASIYYVWRAEGDGAFVKIGSSRTTSFVDKTAAAGKTYRYAIKARYSSFYSQLGVEARTVRLETPAVTIKAYASGLKLTWETVPGATLYNIYRKAPGGSYEKIGTSRTLAYVDRTVESGVKYSYYIVAQVSKYVSANSNIVSATAK